jgi:peptidoglycan glycosyltransferase
MEPHVLKKVVDSGGGTVVTVKPKRLDRVMSKGTANELTTMMVAAVQGGTGTSAQISGLQVAGKTGTAETGRQGVNTTWFICFAPAYNPQVAVAVTLENQLHGFGGTTAAPIAKVLMEAVLNRGSK